MTTPQNVLDKAKSYFLDLGERAAKTFAQGAVAGLAIVWGGTALDVHTLYLLSTWDKLATAALGGGIAAVLSLLTSTVSNLKTGTASLSRVVAATAVEQPAPHEPEHAIVVPPPAP